MCVLTAPQTGCFPVSRTLLRPPYSLRHNNIEIKPVNNSTMTSKCSSKSHVSIPDEDTVKIFKMTKDLEYCINVVG